MQTPTTDWHCCPELCSVSRPPAAHLGIYHAMGCGAPYARMHNPAPAGVNLHPRLYLRLLHVPFHCTPLDCSPDRVPMPACAFRSSRTMTQPCRHCWCITTVPPLPSTPSDSLLADAALVPVCAPRSSPAMALPWNHCWCPPWPSVPPPPGVPLPPSCWQESSVAPTTPHRRCGGCCCRCC